MRCDRGYTLLEAMIVLTLLIVVLGGTLSLLDTTAKIAPQENERAHAVREAQVGLAFLTRELRQARSVSAYGPSGLTVRTPVQGVPKLVKYDCGAASASMEGLHACERVEYAGDGTTVASTTRPLDRLVSDQVFEYTVRGGVVEFVRARIRVPASGEREEGLEHEIVLDDGFFLRNLDGG